MLCQFISCDLQKICGECMIHVKIHGKEKKESKHIHQLCRIEIFIDFIHFDQIFGN